MKIEYSAGERSCLEGLTEFRLPGDPRGLEISMATISGTPKKLRKKGFLELAEECFTALINAIKLSIMIFFEF